LSECFYIVDTWQPKFKTFLATKMGAPALNHRSVRPGKVNVRKNPQEHSWMRGRTKKMPNCIHSWALVLVEAAGIEPASANLPQAALHT